MRISDWSSDVCSSDLRPAGQVGDRPQARVAGCNVAMAVDGGRSRATSLCEQPGAGRGNGRASARRDLRRMVGRTDRGDRRAIGRGRHGYCTRSEEHTSELQSLMRISYAVFCLKTKKKKDKKLNRNMMRMKQ